MILMRTSAQAHPGWARFERAQFAAAAIPQQREKVRYHPERQEHEQAQDWQELLGREELQAYFVPPVQQAKS
jgi:hypothetical protein